MIFWKNMLESKGPSSEHHDSFALRTKQHFETSIRNMDIVKQLA